MLLKDKTAIAYMTLIGLIIAIITLLILVVWVKNISEDSEYNNKLLMCNKFFIGMNGKPIYFGDNTDEFTSELDNGVSTICPAKDVEITNRNINPALELLQNCWYMTGSGIDIMPKIANDMNLCIYCGKISPTSDIDNFRDKISEKLKDKDKYSFLTKDSEIVNLNLASFESSQIPSSISKENEYTVFYYISKPLASQTIFDEIGRNIRNFIGSTSSFGALSNYYVLDDLMVGNVSKTIGGLVLIKQNKFDEDDFAKIKNDISSRGCHVIFPEQTYKY